MPDDHDPITEQWVREFCEPLPQRRQLTPTLRHRRDGWILDGISIDYYLRFTFESDGNMMLLHRLPDLDDDNDGVLIFDEPTRGEVREFFRLLKITEPRP